MKTQTIFIDFILRQWLVIVSGVGLALTSIHTGHVPVYSRRELEVLFILFTLFVTVNGLHRSGFILRVTRGLNLEKATALKLVLATFFLSMILTNDIALLIVVPLTLSLGIRRRDILVILEILAANAGSALTPIGNPQNLFIYWTYRISPGTFMRAIAPFSIFFLVALTASSLFVTSHLKPLDTTSMKMKKKTSCGYCILLFFVLLSVFHLVPVYLNFFVVVLAVVFDRKALRVDYSLLLSFLFFFGVADNLRQILAAEVSHSGHIFIFSALASQAISNVPATLIFAEFTSNWKALLWGANAGGFGSLFGSLANLIAYKLYISSEKTNDIPVFTMKFLVISYAAFFLSMGLYTFWVL